MLKTEMLERDARLFEEFVRGKPLYEACRSAGVAQQQARKILFSMQLLLTDEHDRENSSGGFCGHVVRLVMLRHYAEFWLDRLANWKLAHGIVSCHAHRNILRELLKCFLSWEPQARPLGNVLAGEAADAIECAMRSIGSTEFYKTRCDALQRCQDQMRDPERTMVCDILANGQLMDPAHAGDRYHKPKKDCECSKYSHPRRPEGHIRPQAAVRHPRLPGQARNTAYSRG